MLFKRILYLTLAAFTLLSCIEVESEIAPQNLPKIIVSGSAEVTRTGAVIKGSISGNGLESVRSYGFYLAESSSMAAAQTYTINTDMAYFEYVLDGLESGQTYFYQVFADNGFDTVTSSAASFTTLVATAPTLADFGVDKNGTTYNLHATVTDNGGSDVKKAGFVWDTKTNPTTASRVSEGTWSGDDMALFTGSITEDKYEPGVTYYVRAYVEYDVTGAGSVSYTYSEELQFKTDAVKPTVETSDADPATILSTTAVLGGNVLADGGLSIAERGIVISRQNNPTLENSTANPAVTAGTGAFNVSVSDLEIKTKYYFRAYARNDVGVSYGAVKEFTTLEGKPVVVTKEVLRTTGVSATINCNVTDGGTTDVTDRGVVWSTSPNPTLANNSKSADTAGTGSYDITISENLVSGTTYYVRAFATNSSGTSYGEDLTFQLKADTPKLTLNKPDNITSSSADVSASITDSFGMDVTDKGFVWSSAEKNPTLDSQNTKKISAGSGSAAFSATIDELEPGTVYYVRAYAINASGEGYSSTQAFTSSNTAPVVTTSEVKSVEETRATVGGVVTNNGGEEVTEHGVFYGTSTDPVKNGSKLIIPGDRDDFSRVLDKLERNTTYYVVAYAKNKIGTGYGESKSFRTKMERPAVKTGAVTEITLTSAKVSAEVTSAGGGTVLERGVVFGTSANPDFKTGKKVAHESSSVGAFTCSLTGLAPNTVYFVRAYVTNQDWSEDSAVFGEEISFITDSNGNAEDWNNNKYTW